MGQQIIKQTRIDGEPFVIDGEECEEGKYAIWSTVVDNFIAINLSKEEVTEFFVAQVVESVKREIPDRLKRADETGGSGHRPFKTTFAGAIKTARRVHGEKGFDEKEDEDEEPPREELKRQPAKTGLCPEFSPPGRQSAKHGSSSANEDS